MKLIAKLGGLAFTALLANSAAAAVITLDANPTTFYQQTAASPCVIGGENCLNGGFPYTVAGSGGAGSVFDETSPVYSFADITGLTGNNQFIIGIDYNDTSKDQILNEFSMIFCSDATCSSSAGTAQTYTGPTNLKTTNNGVGWSDFLLLGFDLGDNNGGDGFVKFHANWFNNDGPDRYFIVGCEDCGSEEPPEVPEPSSMLLMGGGLVGLAWWRKRRNG